MPINTQPNAMLAAKRFSPKMLLFIILGLMFISVFIYSEVPLLSPISPGHKRMISMQLLLIPHIIFGLAGLVIGPFQFSSRLRNRRLKLHRLLGKIYVASILLGAVLAILIAEIYMVKAPAFVTFQLVVQSCVWIVTTLMAFIAARRKQIALHKSWMARSYGATLFFVFARVFSPLPFFVHMDVNGFVSYLWLLTVAALVLPDILVNWKAVFGKKKKVTSKGGVGVA